MIDLIVENFNEDAHKRFLNGDGITDEELVELINYYNHLEKMLEILDKDFSLPLKEVRMRLFTLNQFRRLRGL